MTERFFASLDQGTPRALALETGRLDDVFGALTGKARPAAERFDAVFEAQDKGAAS